MKKKPILSDITKNFIGAPYKLGGESRQEGYDCLSMIRCFYSYYGLTLGYPFIDGKELTKEGYMVYFSTHAEDGSWKAPYLRYLLSLGKKVDKNYIRTGDLLILNNDDLIVPAIVIGNACAMVMLNIGITAVPLRNLRIIEVIKCQLS